MVGLDYAYYGNREPDDEKVTTLIMKDAKSGMIYGETCSVKGTEIIGFFLDDSSSRPRVRVINESCIQIRINCHLLSRHGVQCKTCCNLRYSL